MVWIASLCNPGEGALLKRKAERTAQAVLDLFIAGIARR
jgi:hypothetical protein